MTFQKSFLLIFKLLLLVKCDDSAILVTGGWRTESSAELISTNGSSICELPSMPHSKYLHTQSGLTACGTRSGRGPLGFHDNLRSCIKFDDGSWTTLTDNLLAHRYGHSSWVTPEGDILLIGGTESLTTTEIVYKDGTSIRSFDLKYKTRWACSIEMPEMFILTGGYHTLKTVSRYSTSGWMEDLPEMNDGRNSHGCGYFYNDDMQRVFLVAGGRYNYNDLSSTETLVEGGQAWNLQQPMPTVRAYLRGISLPNTVFMTGGSGRGTDGNDVLAYVPETSDWNKVGSMKKRRTNHAASLVTMVNVFQFCKN